MKKIEIVYIHDKLNQLTTSEKIFEPVKNNIQQYLKGVFDYEHIDEHISRYDILFGIWVYEFRKLMVQDISQQIDDTIFQLQYKLSANNSAIESTSIKFTKKYCTVIQYTRDELTTMIQDIFPDHQDWRPIIQNINIYAHPKNDVCYYIDFKLLDDGKLFINIIDINKTNSIHSVPLTRDLQTYPHERNKLINALLAIADYHQLGDKIFELVIINDQLDIPNDEQDDEAVF